MMQPSPDSYESLRDSLNAVPSAGHAGERDVAWLAGETVGASRDERGQLEIFMRGPRLNCIHPNVGVRVDHDEWLQKEGTRIEANRLVLPAGGHYDALAAFILAHLIENGAKDDIALGFRRSEAAISVILETWSAHEEKMIGLSGEVLVLRELLRQAHGHTADIFDAWQGHQHTARDFQLGAAGAEVKTTRWDSSRHHINGVRQVELGHRRDGGHETHLFLLSVSIESITAEPVPEHAWSLPSLVDDVLTLLENAGLDGADRERIREGFLAKVHDYGDGGWYEHGSASSRAMHDQPFRTRFVRSYDMTDDAIGVIRSRELQTFAPVLPATLRYEVELPDQVHGDLNPVTGFVPAIRQLVDTAGWSKSGLL